MKRFLKRAGILIVTVVTLSVTVISYQGYQMYKNAIKELPLEERVSLIQENPDYVPLSDVSQMFVDATVATEDERFYKRNSVLDVEALARALWTNLTHFSAKEGGSTLPQQVSKNLYFQDDFSLYRKIAEYFVTRDLMRYYSKDEILGMYINMNYYGDGFHGIKQASEGYFGSTPSTLSDAEATLLAGIVQAPAHYQLSTNYEGARKRQKHVLSRLVSRNYINSTQSDEIYNSIIMIKE